MQSWERDWIGRNSPVGAAEPIRDFRKSEFPPQRDEVERSAVAYSDGTGHSTRRNRPIRGARHTCYPEFSASGASRLSSTALVIAVFEFVLLIFSLSFHECAHAWMASRLGDQTA